MKTLTLTLLIALLLLNCSCRTKTSESNEPSQAQAASASQESSNPNPALAEMVKTAPDFTLPNYDGKNISLSDYKGKIVVLEWFNYECPFSKYHHETVRTMAQLAEKYKDKNVVWLAVNSTGHASAEKNREFADQFKTPYPILGDFDGTVGHLYDAKTTPHMFIIDAKGNLVYNGAIDNAPLGKPKDNLISYVDNALTELTSGKSVTTAKTDSYGCTVKYRAK